MEITVECVETCTYRRSFDVPDDFDTGDAEAVADLWNENPRDWADDGYVSDSTERRLTVQHAAESLTSNT